MTEPLWSFDAVLDATAGRAEGGGAPGISSVSIDSRTVKTGALFAAIRGESRDGHDYAGQAFAAGAAAALVAQDAKLDMSGVLIRVPDTLEALNRLGSAARARGNARIIAVTGSAGKTGVKEALRLALGASGRVYASDKSYNNHWGVPLSLANFARGNDFGVFEAGMNHAGEITPLTKLIRPHIAIVTTIAPVHLEYFTSVEKIAEAKAEIFAGLEPGGTAILNRDEAHFDYLKRCALAAGAGRIIGFGVHESADARLLKFEPVGDASDVDALIDGKKISYRIGAPGRHLAMNSLSVLAALAGVGADIHAGAQALAEYRAQAGRGARMKFTLDDGPVLLIDESYNANPASMRAALAVLAQTPRAHLPRRIAVLGDMLELGETSTQLHAQLAQPVDAAGVDVVFACGPHMRHLYDALPETLRGAWGENSTALETALLATVRAGDAVMVKGSLGSAMGPLVEALRAHLIR